MGRMATSDPANKLIFSDDRTVADLLRGFVAAQWHGELNFNSLTKRSSEFIGEALAQRIGDMAWTLEFAAGGPLDDGGRPYLAVLLEFQSQVDWNMAWRVSEYAHLLHRELQHSGAYRREGRMPPVLPAVVYNGERPWPRSAERPAQFTRAPGNGVLPPGLLGRAYAVLDESAWAGDDGDLLGNRLPSDNRVTTLIGLDGAPVDELARRLAAAFEQYGGSGEAGLREGFYARVEDRLRRHGGSRLPPLAELERALAERRGGEMATLLDARIRAWRDEMIAQGIEQGIARGQAQGLEQGQARGIEQGRADERALLCRQAARRFGGETAQRLSGLLEGLKAADELAAVGDWIVDCKTGADLLARVRTQ